MSTATIKPKTGTPRQWTESGRILDLYEWGVSVTEDRQYILKIGDGINKFDDLPAAVSTPYYEEIKEYIQKTQEQIEETKENIASGIEEANNAIAEAKKVAEDAKKIVSQKNQLIDEVTGENYQLGVANGNIFIEKVEEE